MTTTKTTIRKKNSAAIAKERPQELASPEIANLARAENDPVGDVGVDQAAALILGDAASAVAQSGSGRAVPSTKAARLAPATTKAEIILKKLRASRGASIDMLVEATGWQAHSVRGFLSATVKKKLGFSVESDVGKDGVRRYRIIDQAA